MRYWCENCFCCSYGFPEKVADVRLESFFSLTNPLSSRATPGCSTRPPKWTIVCYVIQDIHQDSSEKCMMKLAKTKTLHFMDKIWGFGSVCTPGYMVKIRITFTMKLQCVLFWPSTNYDLICGTFIVWLHSWLKSLKNFQRLFPFFLAFDDRTQKAFQCYEMTHYELSMPSV